MESTSTYRKCELLLLLLVTLRTGAFEYCFFLYENEYMRIRPRNLAEPEDAAKVLQTVFYGS